MTAPPDAAEQIAHRVSAGYHVIDQTRQGLLHLDVTRVRFGYGDTDTDALAYFTHDGYTFEPGLGGGWLLSGPGITGGDAATLAEVDERIRSARLAARPTPTDQ